MTIRYVSTVRVSLSEKNVVSVQLGGCKGVFTYME